MLTLITAWWAYAFQLLPQQPPAWVLCLHRLLPWLLPEWLACVLWQLLDQTPVRETHGEVGLKLQVSPRAHVTKEVELKSLLVPVKTVELHHQWYLTKSSTCKTSERKTGAPAAGTCLALAAVGFVGTYTWGLGQTRVWAASIASTADPSAQLLQSWDLTSVDLHQWPGENNAWESPRPTASIHTVKAGMRAVPTRMYFVSPQNGWKGKQQSTLTGEHLQRRNTQWLLSQWECSNPVYLNCRSETQLTNRSGSLYSNN